MTCFEIMEILNTTTKLTDGGRIVIPAEYRRALHLDVGDEVVLSLENDEIRILSRREALRRAQEIVSRYITHPLVDELIAERRQEAAGE